MKNSVDVTGKNSKEETVTVIVKKPTPNQEGKAKIHSNKVFAEAITNGALLRAKLTDHMIQQGLWDDKKEEQLKTLSDTIDSGVKRLMQGGCKLSEAKDTALEVTDARQEQLILLSSRRNLDEFTAEGQAENAQFDFLCAACILNEEGKPAYTNLDGYLKEADSELAIKAATQLAELTNGLDPNWEKKLPENEFLMKYKFVNEDLQLIDKDGSRVARDGRLVNDEGRYVDENGDYINYDGDKVDKDGNLIVEFVEFEDDVYTSESEPAAVAE
jgi:hypothetical protein